MKSFRPIKQVKVSEQVLARLKEAILRGIFKAGDKLPSERELTAQFKVSRGVIREAIKALEATDFVAIRQGPNGGAFVNEVNFDRLSSGFLDLYLANKLTIPELIQVRMLIEPEVARLAARHVDDKYRTRLKDAIDGERLPFDTYEDRMIKMTLVHFTLTEMCENYLFESIVHAIIKLTHQIVVAVELEDHNALHGIGEHDAIVEAVCEGNEEKAQLEMKRHLEKFSQALFSMDRLYRDPLRR